MPKFTERPIDVGDVTLNVLSLGEGEPVIMLHGFPAFSECWLTQMRALAAAGFQAIAPDLRGYNRSSKPREIEAYDVRKLVTDIVKLIAELGHESVYLVGHDWGGTLAYCVASSHPEVVRKLVILNAPHPELIRLALRRIQQLVRSWYMFLFQLPWLPEWLIKRRFTMHMALLGPGGRQVFDGPKFEAYLAAIRRSGAARGAVNYYRASFRFPVRAERPIEAKTLVLWGEGDAALSEELLLPGLKLYVPDLKIVRIPNAGHWVHHERPDLVNSELLAFLAA